MDRLFTIVLTVGCGAILPLYPTGRVAGDEGEPFVATPLGMLQCDRSVTIQ